MDHISYVNTVIYKVDPLHPDQEIIAKCAQVIQKGGLVAFPTETVYGLGASALNPDAVDSVFEAKARPRDNPLIVHVSRLEGVNPLVAQIPPRAKKLMEIFWPGPLTLLFPKSEIVPDVITAGLPNVAIRMPGHPVSQMLIDACGVPLVAPSANQSGRPSPTCARDVLADLEGKVDIILDGGTTDIGVESTVLDVSGDIPIILRPGGITREQIESVLNLKPNAIKLSNGYEDTSDAGGLPMAKYQHYAPKAAMYLATGTLTQQRRKIIFHGLRLALSGSKPVVLVSEENAEFYTPFQQVFESLFQVITLGSRQDLSPVAARLYSSLRRAEEMGAQVILSETFSLHGLGLAIANRLEEASRGNKLPEFKDLAAQQELDLPSKPSPGISTEPFKIIMVCTGNTCRSPMAEGLFIKLWKEAGEPYPVEVVSRGVTTVPGLPASKEAVQAMKSKGVDISGHLSAPVSSDGLAEADIAITMTQAHKQMLLSKYPAFKNKIVTLSEIVPGVIDGDVIDPFGKSRKVYGDTADLLEESLEVLVKRLSGQEVHVPKD